MKMAIDIGGTNIRVGFIEDSKIIGKVVSFNSITDKFIPNLEKIFEIYKESNNKITGIGIFVPGPLDIANGIVYHTPNLPGWKGTNIKQSFQNKFNLDDVQINNDANGAALGQAIIRENVDSLLYFTISTGIGAGLVFNGRIHNGFSQNACEVANALPNLGANEPLKSGIEYKYSGINIPKELNKLGVEIKTTKEAFELYYEKNNPEVNNFFTHMKAELVKFFATSIYLINPQIIVVGGSVALNNKQFYDEVFKETQEITQLFINYKTPIEYATDLENATLLACEKI